MRLQLRGWLAGACILGFAMAAHAVPVTASAVNPAPGVVAARARHPLLAIASCTLFADYTVDHVLGRPSIKFRKIQVFAVVSFWSLYLLR